MCTQGRVEILSSALLWPDGDQMCSKHLTEALSNSTAGSHLLITVILLWFYSQCSYHKCPPAKPPLGFFLWAYAQHSWVWWEMGMTWPLVQEGGGVGLVPPRASVCLSKDRNQETQPALNKDNSYKGLNHLVGRKNVIHGSPALPKPLHSQKL